MMGTAGDTRLRTLDGRVDEPVDERREPGVGKAAALLTSATAAASAVNYGVNLVLARWMPPSEFGDANLVVTLMLAATAIAVALQLVAAQRVSTDPQRIHATRRQLLRHAKLLGVGTGALLAASSPAVASVTSSSSAVPFALLALGLPALLAQSVDRGVLQGQLRFGALASTLLIEAAVRFTAALGLVALGTGAAGASAAISASFVFTWWCARQLVRRPCAQQAGARSDTGGPAAVPGHDRRVRDATALLLIGQIVINNGDVVVAKVLFDAESAGVYAVIALVGRAVFFLTWSVATVVFPHAAASPSNDPGVGGRAVRYVAMLCTLITIAVAVLAPPMTPVLFGSDYHEATSLFAPYAAATSLFALANLTASIAAARGRRAPATIVAIGAAAQTALLTTAAHDLAGLVRLQILAMTLLLVAIAVADRRTRCPRAWSPTPRPGRPSRDRPH